jgi:tRNA A37 threonylcarbamoyladenosine modification protein TsaB
MKKQINEKNDETGYTLIINTVFEKLTVTVLKDEYAQYHCEYFEKKRNAFKIDRIIEDAFKTCDIEFKDITGVAAFTGPGSFTGIKLGLSMAYAMIVSAPGCVKKTGLSMLDYLIFDSFSKIKKNKTAAALVPGVKGEYFCRLIKNYNNDPKESFAKSNSAAVVSSDALSGEIKPDYIIIEECAGAFPEDKKLGEYRGDKLIVSSVRPKAVAAFFNYCQNIDQQRILELNPIYLKDTYAVKPKVMTA